MIEAVFLATVGFAALALFAGVRRAEPRWLGYTAMCSAAWLGLRRARDERLARRLRARPPHFFAFTGRPRRDVRARVLAVRGAPRRAPRLGGAHRLPGLPRAGRVGARLAAAGVVPPQMTCDGANFDVLTGLSAPLVAWLAARGTTRHARTPRLERRRARAAREHRLDRDPLHADAAARVPERAREHLRHALALGLAADLPRPGRAVRPPAGLPEAAPVRLARDGLPTPSTASTRCASPT